VDRLVVSQANNLRVGDVEIGIVFGDDGIVHDRAGEFHGALHPAGDDGIRIYDATGCIRFRSSRSALLQEKRRHIWRRRGYWTIVDGAPMKDRP
jgi:hypothetical protein